MISQGPARPIFASALLIGLLFLIAFLHGGREDRKSVV